MNIWNSEMNVFFSPAWHFDSGGMNSGNQVNTFDRMKRVDLKTCTDLTENGNDIRPYTRLQNLPNNNKTERLSGHSEEKKNEIP